jgi:hypothetical protein
VVYRDVHRATNVLLHASAGAAAAGEKVNHQLIVDWQ